MELVEKVEAGARLGFEEGLALYDLELMTLGKLANRIRRARFGDKVYFNINRHINPSNVCADVCKFCAYSASRKNPHPYTMSIDEIIATADEAIANGAKELHIVSAHNPELSLAWHEELFRALKERHPQIHIKAMTAAEVDFIHRQEGIGYEEILLRLQRAGMDSMPGGGAEIFDEKVRDYICKGKVSSENWLAIHGIWHTLGGKSNATMLFGHVETRAHRIDHILRLREQQDKTNGFNAFIPLLYQRKNNFLQIKDIPTGQEILKTIAISRILLDNIPHIKAYWVTSTLGLALVAQEFGADDLDGTIQKESINSAAGAKSAHGVPLEVLVSQIMDAGFIPVERDSLYHELKVW
ncbi:MAG: aminofutalosine synthase MqnE [Campylobacterales bacterium]